MKAYLRDLGIVAIIIVCIALILLFFTSAQPVSTFDYCIDLYQPNGNDSITVSSAHCIIRIPFDSLEEYLLEDNL